MDVFSSVSEESASSSQESAMMGRPFFFVEEDSLGV